jgi:hypothetical protein
MDRARIERMAQALDRPEIAALDPDRLATLRRALDGADPPLAAGRHGALIAFSAGTPRRRLLELDRRGHLVAAFRWAEDGRLAWAKCRTAHGDWIGVEPGAGARAAWGDSDAICRLAPDAVWKPRESLTVFQAVDWARLEWIPPLAAPQRLPPGAGTAVTTGPTLGKWPPVSVIPFATSSGISPKGICQRIVPAFKSYEVIVVHGGAIAESPLLVIMKPNELV